MQIGIDVVAAVGAVVAKIKSVVTAIGNGRLFGDNYPGRATSFARCRSCWVTGRIGHHDLPHVLNQGILGE
jgi:hypothetical protein